MTAVPEQEAERRCAGTTVDGAPCGAVRGLLIEDETAPGTYWCISHHPDPDYADTLHAGRSKGGRHSPKGQRHRYLDAADLGALETPADAQRIAALVAMAVATGRLSSAAGGVVLKAVDAFLRSVEVVDLAAQVAALETRFGRRP